MADEKQFKKWLKSRAPHGCLFNTIETMTSIGVPDIFTCYKGCSRWIETKDISTSTVIVKLRATQYMWLQKLINNGGSGGLLIRHKYNTDFYDAIDIMKIDKTKIKTSGKDYILTGLVEPSLTLDRRLSRQEQEQFMIDVLRGI